MDDRVDQPISLYAATKRADELISYAYSHMFGIRGTGLRSWSRPDMAIYIFTSRILAGKPIKIFNNGDMNRAFTYIDDVVAGTLAALDREVAAEDGRAPHFIYNLGNHESEPLLRVVSVIVCDGLQPRSNR